MLDRLKKVFGTVNPDIDVSGITEGTRLQQDLGLNSLSIMLLAMAIEDEFQVNFENAPAFETVGDVLKFLEENGK